MVRSRQFQQSQRVLHHGYEQDYGSDQGQEGESRQEVSAQEVGSEEVGSEEVGSEEVGAQEVRAPTKITSSVRLSSLHKGDFRQGRRP